SSQEVPFMKTQIVCAGLLLTALPAAAQSRVYTNRDLTPRPVTAWTRTVTAEELRGLATRQFRLPPPLPPDGPTVVILPDTPLFAPFEPTRPLSEPWSMTTYLGRGVGHGYGHGQAGPAGPAHVQPGIHLVYGRR